MAGFPHCHHPCRRKARRPEEILASAADPCCAQRALDQTDDDDELRAQILPLERKFARGAHDMVVQMLNADDSDPHTHRLIQATLDLARGLGLADVLTDDSVRRTNVAKAWAQQLTGIKTID